MCVGRGRDDDSMGRRPRDPWEEGLVSPVDVCVLGDCSNNVGCIAQFTITIKAMFARTSRF